jgi:hypothetical protein
MARFFLKIIRIHFSNIYLKNVKIEKKSPVIWALQIPWQIRPVIWPSRTRPPFRKARKATGGSPLVVVDPSPQWWWCPRGLYTRRDRPRWAEARDGSISPRGGGRRRRSPVLFRPRQRGAARSAGVRGPGVHRPRPLLRLQRTRRVRQGPR